nr:MAG TPA: hypothetical protein [Caudoviricetes sp.]
MSHGFARYLQLLRCRLGAGASVEELDRRRPGLDFVLHPQGDTHKKPPISHVQEMGGSSHSTARGL